MYFPYSTGKSRLAQVSEISNAVIGGEDNYEFVAMSDYLCSIPLSFRMKSTYSFKLADLQAWCSKQENHPSFALSTATLFIKQSN